MISLFEPHLGQLNIIKEFVEPEYVLPKDPNDPTDFGQGIKWGIVTTGRQFGKTLLAINSIAYWLLNDPNTKGLWITPFSEQGLKVFDEFRHALASEITSSNRTYREARFSNGSHIKFMSAENHEACRGYTFDYCIMDESAYIKQEALKVILPTLDVKGKKVMMISTPFVKNWYYDWFMRGEDPSIPNIKSFKARSIDNPYFSASSIESARESLPEDIIQQEYFAEFSDADGTVFEGFSELCMIDEYQGSYEDACYLGVDIALGGKDMTCCVLMNAQGEVINIERWKESNTEKQIHRIKTLMKSYSVHRGFIEINQERGIQQSVRKEYPQIKEWTTTRKNKPEMIQNLKKDIEDKLIKLPTKRLDPICFNEMSKFTYEKKEDGYIKYGHPEGGHDDTVIALALANEARVPNRHIRRNWLSDFKLFN